ncbi:MAG TPA: hypothetical protein VMQ50_15965 [Casimicrobiaceae bacterium]|nr:hypothetical protein [Casimicrobiaceae bacterium]
MSTVDRIALTAMLSAAVVIPLLCGMAFRLDTRLERSARAPAPVLNQFKSNRGAATMAVAAGRD